MKTIIVITTIDICAGNSAASARIMNIAKSLAQSNHQVLLCSVGSDKDMSLDHKRELSRNIYAIGEIHRRERENRLFSGVTGIWRSLTFVIKIGKLAANINGKIVFYLYPSTKVALDIFTLIYLKLIRHRKIYYELNEVRLFTLHNRSFSGNPLKNIYDRAIYYFDLVKYTITEKLTRYYDGLLVISTGIEHYFRRYHANLLRIPILSDTGKKQFTSARIFDRSKNERFSICFTGMIMLKKEGFDLLYEALSTLKREGKQVDLHLYGPISGKERDLLLHTLPAKLGIDGTIYYHGVVGQDVLIREMQKYHLLILPRPLTPQTSTGFSTKLSEYMVSGVPVLVTDVGDNKLFIRDGYNGYIVPPGDPIAMANKIGDIMDHYGTNTNEIVENAFKTAAENFHYGQYSKSLAEFMN